MWRSYSMYFTIGICQVHFSLLVLIIAEASGFSFINPPKCSSAVINIYLPYPQVGNDLVLDCRTTDLNSKSTLYYTNRPISMSSIRYSSNGSVYTIPSIGFTSGGTYNCTAENMSGQKISWQCLIIPRKFKLETTFVNRDAAHVYVTGQSFNITCKVTIDGFIWNSTTIKLYKWVNTAFVQVPDQSVVRGLYGKSREVILPFIQAPAMPSTQYQCIAHTTQHNGYTKKSSITVTVRDPEPAKIVSFPSSKSIVVKPSERITIRCSATGFPKPEIFKWLKNGTEITECLSPSCTSDGYSMHPAYCSSRDDTCLTILSATYPKDEGTYTCSASNGYGPPDRRSVRAVFHLAPRIDKSGSTTVVQQINKAKNISCRSTQGYPLPTFTWTQSPMLCRSVENCQPTSKWLPIESNHRQQPSANIPTSSSTLTIPASMVRSFYKCVATNSLGQDSHVLKFLRTKLNKPSVAIKSPDTFDAEETLKVTCIISYGTFTRWFKDGQKIYPSRDPRVVVKTQKKSDVEDVVTLTIANLTTSDSGLYACKAKDHDASKMTDSKYITVKALFAPNITSLPNITAYDYFNNETNIQLTCHVTANPIPRVTWSKLGTSLLPLENVKNCDDILSGYYLKKSPDGIGNTLLICDAHDGHTGLYTCLAENSKGSDSKTAYVDVLVPPRIKRDKPYELLLKSPGESIDIPCQATGNPKPDVIWTKMFANGSAITLQRKGSHFHFATLKIPKLGAADFGNYTCIATNSRGSDRMLIEIRDPAKGTELPPGPGSKILLIAASVGGSVGLVLLVAILVCCVLSRRHNRLIEEYKAIKYLRRGEDYKLDPDRTLLEQCENLPYDADWEFPVKRLILQGIIGSGSFGQVMKAEAIGILSFTARDKTSDAFKRRSRLRRRLSSSRIYHDSSGRDYNNTIVAVKSLKADAKESDYKDLATELKIMIHLGEHTNIINLLGACTRTKQLMVIMEFAPHGNLLNFLRCRREIYEATWRKTSHNPEAEFTLADLVMYSYQIARGMDFLSSKKCVHRDLAARNILVGEDYVMKIADFGLARDIYKTDLYIKETTGLLPVKWMAPESLFDRVYTQKTDVWSFGVVLWESQTLGGTPYPGIPVEELLDYLSEGKRMRQPRDCPPEIYAIMRDCWLQKPEERPTFSELVRRIERILEKKISGQENDSSYISVFMDEDLHRIYYMEPSEAKPGNSTSSIQPQSMTEDEIQASPLPPVPSLSLENIHEASLKDGDSPNYCDPVDNHPAETRYVESPTSPTRSLPRGEKSPKFKFYQNDKRNSGASTGVESGIELDDDQSLERRNDNRWNAYNHKNRLSQPVDASGVSLLDPSVVKNKTHETML